MPSQRKLNTYGVESPCERSPRVGSFLANPGLSKEQLVRRCIVITFAMRGYIHWNMGIKPTALCGENIHYGECIHWDISTTPTALHRCNIQNGKYIH